MNVQPINEVIDIGQIKVLGDRNFDINIDMVRENRRGVSDIGKVNTRSKCNILLFKSLRANPGVC